MSFKGTVRATRPTDWKRYSGSLNDEISGAAPTGGGITSTYVAGGVVGDPSPGAMRATSGYLQYATSWVVNNQAPFTMALLFKTENPGSWVGGGTSILCSGDYNGASNGGAYIGSYMAINNSNQFIYAFGEPNLASFYTMNSLANVTDGNWHMAVMMSDGANNPSLAAYLDGVLISSTTLSATLVRLGNNSAASLVAVGADIGGGNATIHPVLYDEFIIWNRVLSAGEVAMLWDEVSRGYAPGTYQEPLAPRYNYDQDGTTVAFHGYGGDVATFSSSDIQALTDENAADFTKAARSGLASTNYLEFVFPVAMDIYHVNLAGDFLLSGVGTAQITSISQSPDGSTFTTAPAAVQNNGVRTFGMSTALPATNVKVLRINMSAAGGPYNPSYFGLVQLYGLPYVTAAPQAVALWHPVADTPLPGGGVDFGDVGPTTSRDRQFRLKNLHGSLTASGTLLTLAALTDVSPSLTTEYEFSVGGGSFGSTAAVGNISPGAISPVITMRRVGASGAPSGTHAIQVDIAATFV